MARVTWHGNADFHTVLEVIATQLALTTGAIALVRYYAKRSWMFLLIGTGFLGAGLLDAYHALITASFMAGRTPTAFSALTHWSGAVSRVFLSVLLMASLLAQKKRAIAGRRAERLVYFGVGSWCLVSFVFFLLVPLRPAYYPDLPIHRPAELVPALFFTLAAVGYCRKGSWRLDDFEHSVLLSLIPAAISHLVYLAVYSKVGDSMYLAGHLLKILGYGFLLNGLLASMYSAFKREAEHASHLLDVNCSLAVEVKERKKAEAELRQAHDELEERVNVRTADLAVRTTELQDQVHAKELALAELAEAQQRMIELSRLSGMAEIATGVLHNVGNVLNSVNVSTTIAAAKIQEFRLDKLVSAIDILQQHNDDMAAFLKDDPRGQRLIPYLTKLGKNLQEDRQVALAELVRLQDHVAHIKTIVATQQSYAKVSGLIENVCLAELVEDAFHIVQPAFERHQIRLERDFDEQPPLAADKHKILQILLNLLRNAKEAVKQSRQEPRFIRVKIRRQDNERVRIEIKDSGIGVAQENLTRIFAHGFTTKSEGHGYGLHSAALAAREMSGSLWVESDGVGLGATFILELPLTKVQEMSLV